jgi:5'-3' exonuclease
MNEYLPLRGQMRMKFDIERIIDDFIFFCFFIGNDFLPSLSALDIAEGSLDKLIEFYKTCLPNMENYITHDGTIHWDRAEPFIWLLGEHENETFKNRIDEMSHKYERKGSVVSVSADTMAEAANIAGHSGNARSADHLQAMLRS